MPLVVSGIAVLAQSGVEFAPERSLLLVAIACGIVGLAIAAALATRATTPTTPPAASSTGLTEPPALVDHLLGDGTVSTMALPATVVHLADRGHLELARPITASTRVVAGISTGDDLLDYERDLLERLDGRSDLTVAHLSWYRGRRSDPTPPFLRHRRPPRGTPPGSSPPPDSRWPGGWPSSRP